MTVGSPASIVPEALIGKGKAYLEFAQGQAPDEWFSPGSWRFLCVGRVHKNQCGRPDGMGNPPSFVSWSGVM